MTSPRDYYEVLGVGRGASADEIRRAHRKLARQHHPDVNKAADAARCFAEIQEAYDVLSDSEKRKAYDQFGHAGVGVGAGAADGRGAARAGPASWTWTSGGGAGVDPAEFASIFEEMFGRGPAAPGAPFGAAAARARPRARPAQRGQDVEHTLNITFMTAALGGVEQLRIATEPGERETIEVKIPPGVDSGAKLRIRGKGALGFPASGGGPKGDLILTIQVGPHPCFRRERLDLLVDVPITIVEAALGTTVKAPLLKGSAEVKVPPGASSGRKLRIKGRGITDSKGGTGDFYVVIQIVAPAASELSEEDQPTLEELGRRLKNPRESAPWADQV